MLWRAPWLRQRLALIGLAAWDAVALYISYNFVYIFRIEKWEGLSLGFAVVVTTWLVVSYLAGRYSPTEKKGKGVILTEILITATAGMAVLAIFIAHSWIYQVVDAQTRFRGFLIPLVVSAVILSTLGQSAKRRLAHKRREWILIGDFTEETTVKSELEFENEELRSRTTVTSTASVTNLLNKKSYLTTGVAVGNTEQKSDEISNEIFCHRERGGCVMPLTSWCEQELQRIPPELVHRDWLIQAEGFGLRPGSISLRVKRISDVLGAALLLAITAPLMVVAALCIWIEDRGPIFYRQVRTGLYGRKITIWKLRSMRVDAEKTSARWATKGDKRITRIGNILRATRIDELPQLVSVLNGELSLIGPRPERPAIEEDLEKWIPNYRVRHWIKPGLSGWAQVCYPYGASVSDSRMKLSYDLYYIRNANILLDLLIALKTFRLVVRAQGASPVPTSSQEII